MALMSLLAELYTKGSLKLNLKFEIEVLARALELELKDIAPTNLLDGRQSKPREVAAPAPTPAPASRAPPAGLHQPASTPPAGAPPTPTAAEPEALDKPPPAQQPFAMGPGDQAANPNLQVMEDPQ